MRLVDFRLLMQNAAEKGFLLIFACAAALFLSNSDMAHHYNSFVTYEVSLVGVHFSVLHFVNDVLMALFFLSVGMEIKREIVEGHLSTRQQLMLPMIAAVGGVVVPVLIYVFFNHSDPVAIRGWAVPAATDIAFALGILALFGKGLPTSLRVFLAALAIIDDLIAVLIIAIFYGGELSLFFLIAALMLVVVIIALNKIKVLSVPTYLFFGVVLWYFVVKSGIHATIAGVLLGFLIPLHSIDHARSPLRILERNLSPYILYFVLPIFAFANSGVHLGGVEILEIIKTPVSMGIMLGLFFGKQIGVCVSSYIAYKLNIIAFPTKATVLQFFGVAVICGIGFTMSLFVGMLAFSGYDMLMTEMKVGVLIGSLISAIFGGIILLIAKITNR